MKWLRVGIRSVLLGIALAACAAPLVPTPTPTPSPTPEPTPTPFRVTTSEFVALEPSMVIYGSERRPGSSLSYLKRRLEAPESRTSRATVPWGASVEVSVLVRQDAHESLRCAQPIVWDPFGRFVAVLELQADGTETQAEYRGEFVAGEEGRYEVELDNLECSLPPIDSTALVTWTVTPHVD